MTLMSPFAPRQDSWLLTFLDLSLVCVPAGAEQSFNGLSEQLQRTEDCFHQTQRITSTSEAA